MFRLERERVESLAFNEEWTTDPDGPCNKPVVRRPQPLARVV